MTMRVAGISAALLDNDTLRRIVDTVRSIGSIRLVVLSQSRPTDLQGRHREGDVPETAIDDAGARIASELGIHTIAGPAVERYDSERYIVARIRDPDGAVIGAQRKTHLSPRECEHGFARGDEISVFDVDGTGVGLMIGDDVRYPEVGRIMALQEAELIAAMDTTASTSGNDGADRHASARHCEALGWSETDSLWAQVQQNQCWAVATGAYSVVIAPCEITAGMSGYLSWDRAAKANRLSIAVGDLDHCRRDRLKACYPLLDLLNPEAYRDYLPALYAEGVSRARRS